MPIRPSERVRYPKDWRDISARIRARDGQQCKWCAAPNGKTIYRADAIYILENGETRDAVTGEHLGWTRGSELPEGRFVRVVLTVAHLGRPVPLPLDLHVAGTTETNEVVELVGQAVACSPEGLERPEVMHDRALAEFVAGPSTVAARFVVSLPRCSSSGSPGRSVVGLVAAAPVWVLLSGWRLSAPPSKSAPIPAESSPEAQVVSGDSVRAPAAFARPLAETTLAQAYEFVATGRRASFDVVRGLLRCQREDDLADLAHRALRAPSRPGHALIYHVGEMPENCADDNLVALCQRCHLTYDAKHHAQTARATREARSGQKRLFP